MQTTWLLGYDLAYLVSCGQTSIFFLWGQEKGSGTFQDTIVVLASNRFWLGVNWIHMPHYWIRSHMCHFTISINPSLQLDDKLEGRNELEDRGREFWLAFLSLPVCCVLDSESLISFI